MGFIADITAENFSFVYDVNIRAPLLLLQIILLYLRSPGRIINNPSVADMDPRDVCLPLF